MLTNISWEIPHGYCMVFLFCCTLPYLPGTAAPSPGSCYFHCPLCCQYPQGVMPFAISREPQLYCISFRHMENIPSSSFTVKHTQVYIVTMLLRLWHSKRVLKIIFKMLSKMTFSMICIIPSLFFLFSLNSNMRSLRPGIGSQVCKMDIMLCN